MITGGESDGCRHIHSWGKKERFRLLKEMVGFNGCRDISIHGVKGVMGFTKVECRLKEDYGTMGFLLLSIDTKDHVLG